MDKAHNVQAVRFAGTSMFLRVDGKRYRVDIRKHSERLARATPQQRGKFRVSPSGYGIHWPDIDEDLSVEALVGHKRSRRMAGTSA